jgi:hypothetical protein
MKTARKKPAPPPVEDPSFPPFAPETVEKFDGYVDAASKRINSSPLALVGLGRGQDPLEVDRLLDEHDAAKPQKANAAKNEGREALVTEIRTRYTAIKAMETLPAGMDEKMRKRADFAAAIAEGVAQHRNPTLFDKKQGSLHRTAYQSWLKGVAENIAEEYLKGL